MTFVRAGPGAVIVRDAEPDETEESVQLAHGPTAHVIDLEVVQSNPRLEKLRQNVLNLQSAMTELRF
ncbi:MAG: hypothetical protein WCJ29_01950 [bacterium]